MLDEGQTERDEKEKDSEVRDPADPISSGTEDEQEARQGSQNQGSELAQGALQMHRSSHEGIHGPPRRYQNPDQPDQFLKARRSRSWVFLKL